MDAGATRQRGALVLFEFLSEVNRRPEPFEKYTARELWDDPHTSQRMLAYHLDGTIDVASRNHDFLDRSADWIASRFGLTHGIKVADFGCGPGLYAQRLASTGAGVTGLDFSANPLRYARDQAAASGLDIEYVQTDYLDYETDLRFDLILMIMCDFCALSPKQRARLLEKFRSLLPPGGAVLLDVYSLRMFDAREEATSYAPDLMDGFWSADEYFGFLSSFRYEPEKVLLDKYAVVERDRVRWVFNWLQCFRPADIEKEFADCGLTVVQWLGNVAGDAYDPGATEFAVVAQATV
jgi:SAM-dependent methyltransferase